MPSTIWVCIVPGPEGDKRIRAWTADNERAEAFRKEGLEMQEFGAVAQASPEPTPHAIVEAFNDWSYYKKEGEPVGRMLAHEAAKVSFAAGVKWALTVPSAHRLCAKCGCETQSEEALVNGEIWCHPCADTVVVPSTNQKTDVRQPNPAFAPHATDEERN